jgi:hypothetical protein
MAWRAVNPAEYGVRFFLLCSLICVAILLPAPGFGQHYPILPVPNSPHGIVTMFEDSRSRLWLGTIDGLDCFDGTNFYSLRESGFPRETVSSIAEDSDGGIWATTHQRDLRTGQFNGGLYRFYRGSVEKIATRPFASIVRSGAGTMLATEYGGDRSDYADLYLYRAANEHWQAQKVADLKGGLLTGNSSGSITYPCPDGWCELTAQQLKDLASSPNARPVPAFREDRSVDRIWRVLRDRTGCVWLRREIVPAYECPGQVPAMFPAGIDTSGSIAETRDGQILLMSTDITLGRPGAVHTASAANGVPAELQSVLAARDGTIFLGSASGLYRFMHPFQLEFWNQADGVDEPYSILRVDKNVYLSNKGIAKLSEDRSRWVPWSDSAQTGSEVHMLPGPGKTVYAAAIPRGAVQLDEHGKIRAITKCCPGGARLATDGDGKTWLAGTGISLLKPSGDTLQLESLGLDRVLPTDVALDMDYDPSRKTIWACQAMEVVTQSDGKWVHLGTKEGLRNDGCYSITVLPSGDAWMAYSQLGEISRIRPTKDGHTQVDTFKTDVERQTGDDHFLKSDARGWLWMGHSGKNLVATPDAAEHGNWIPLGLQEGIPSPGGNQNAFFADPDRSAWFASGNTVVHFNADKDFATSFPAPIVSVAGLSAGSAGPVLAEMSSQLPHNEQIVAHIGMLQFDRREAIHFRFRLLPGQATWSNSAATAIPLGKFWWGTHTLEVQAQLSTGPWSPVAQQRFSILKPIWLTWPALAAFFVVGSTATAGGARWRRKRRMRREKAFPDLADYRMHALSPELQQLDGELIDGRFEVGRVLARGGFATVIAGRDLHQDGQPCAIKIFRQELVDKEWMARRFQQEVLALSKIAHPNVVGIYGSGTLPGGALYLVMEFIDGATLRELLEIGKLQPQRVASYLRQAGSALDQLHAQGICHRDLKPENLMIRSGAAIDESLVLIDFSIAIVKDPDETLHGLSRAAGTIYYMAPEQAIGYADASTDIYSLAKIVIEMLAGDRLSVLLPNASMDLPDRVRELLGTMPVRLSSVSIELLSSALEFDPARRPKHAGSFALEIARDLEAAVGVAG